MLLQFCLLFHEDFSGSSEYFFNNSYTMISVQLLTIWVTLHDSSHSIFLSLLSSYHEFNISYGVQNEVYFLVFPLVLWNVYLIS